MDFSLTEPERDLVGLCRDFAQKEIAARAPAGVGGGAVPDRPAPRDGRAGPARHADPRGVGRHRHVDRRLRRRDGADRPGRPVGGRRVAGARDDRFVAAVPLRQRRAARALAATAGRGTRARRVRPDRARRRLRRARHPHAGGAARRRLADQRPQDVHLQRRHRHVVRGDAAGPHRVGRRASADVRELRRREGHARLHHGPEDARHRLAGPRHARAVLRRRLGRRRSPRRRSGDGARPVPAHARGRAHLDRGAVAQPDPGRARPGDRLRAASACSSASRSRSSRRSSSSSPTSPPSSRRRAGSRTAPRTCATPGSRSSRKRRWRS